MATLVPAFVFHRPPTATGMKLRTPGRPVKSVRGTANAKDDSCRSPALQMPVDSIRRANPTMAAIPIAPCATDEDERENHTCDEKGRSAIIEGIAGIDTGIRIDRIYGWRIPWRWVSGRRVSGRRVSRRWISRGWISVAGRRRLRIRRTEG
jgi:hypothetical protein